MPDDTTTRDEHLAWCKRRALEYCARGDDAGALASMGSDLNKHPGTCGHIGIKLGVMMLISGIQPPGGMAHFIEGFN